MSRGREMAGRMRERVVLLRRDAARDALGGVGGGWSEIGRVWASVEPEGRGAAFSGEARVGAALWRVTLRPCAVAIGDRIARTDGTIEVREVWRDPRLPDRVVAIAEDVR